MSRQGISGNVGIHFISFLNMIIKDNKYKLVHKFSPTRHRVFLIALRQLTDTLDDTRLLAGSEACDAARAFYKYVKVAAAENLPGAKAVYAALRERFPYIRRRAASESAD
jgi:hypothetical protein